MTTYTANGCEFIAKDDMIVRWLRDDPRRVFEPETTRWMFDVLADRQGAFVDVGVSTGWFAIPIAKAGRKVLAFEPNKRVQERLLENCELNGVGLNLFVFAASDKEGETTFHYNRVLPLTSGGSIEYRPTPDALSETVQTQRVDAVVTDDVALMKVDVEGHELAVLRGAAGVIEQSRPHLVLEANDQEHQDALAGWLAENGYTWISADARNMLCSPK